jgi:hypothetical protein
LPEELDHAGNVAHHQPWRHTVPAVRDPVRHSSPAVQL